jgi:hypothetical protein
VKAAHTLLGAPTIGGGNAWAGDGGGGSLRRQISPQAGQNTQKWRQKQAVPCFFGLKLPKTLFFAQKYFIRYTPKMFFEEYINFKILLLKALWSFTCSKFQESYMPPAIQNWVKGIVCHFPTFQGIKQISNLLSFKL